MKKLNILKTLAIIFLFCSACATVEQELTPRAGPRVTPCELEVKNGGFLCVPFEKDPFTISFGAAQRMECFSVVDLEAFLKACKTKTKVKVTSCQVENSKSDCTDSMGSIFSTDITKLDSYVCFSDQDAQRIRDRCTNGL